MERRAGAVVEAVAAESSTTAAKEAFHLETNEVSEKSSAEAKLLMKDLDEDLGVVPHDTPDTDR